MSGFLVPSLFGLVLLLLVVMIIMLVERKNSKNVLMYGSVAVSLTLLSILALGYFEGKELYETIKKCLEDKSDNVVEAVSQV
jgi:hypothetical protein